MESFGVNGAQIEVEETSGSAGRFVVLRARDVDHAEPGEASCATAALDRRAIADLRDHLTDLLERW